MAEMPNAIKRRLRELAAQAYEKELGQETEALSARFAAWRAGQITIWELNEEIHRFHNSTTSGLFKLYEQRTISEGMIVARAVARGLLQKEDIPPEVYSYIASWVDNFKSDD